MREEEAEARLPVTSAGAQPGRPRVPLNPVTQQIMAGEAGFLLLPPLPGDGQEGGGLPLRPPTRARRPLGSLGVGRGGLTYHLRLASAYRRLPLTVNRPRRSLPFPGWLPNIRRKCVRPGEGRKEGAGRLEGAARAGAPTLQVPRGPGAKGAVRDVGWRRAGRGGGSGLLALGSATPTAEAVCRPGASCPVSTKSLR